MKTKQEIEKQIEKLKEELEKLEENKVQETIDIKFKGKEFKIVK